MQDNTNIDIVRKIYRDFVSGDIDAVLDAMDNNVLWSGRVNWRGGPQSLPYQGTYEGRSGVAECFRSFLGTVQYERPLGDTHYFSSGNHVLATGQDIRRILATGELTEHRWSMFWTFNEGKVVRIRIYEDTVEVLE